MDKIPIITYRYRRDKCDNCGKWIVPKEFTEGATREKINDETWETICSACNKVLKDE